MTVIALSVLFITFLIIINIPDVATQGVRKHFGRFAELYETQQGSGKVRILIWEGAVSIISASPLRLIIGHGLESIFPLYHRYTPPSFHHYEGTAIPDHSHNETFDILITSGVSGMLSYLLIIFAIIYFTLKYSGLISSYKLFISNILAGVILGVVIPIVLNKPLLLGLAIPFGFLAGLILYLVFTWKIEKRVVSDTNTYLLLGLISAIIGHFAEVQFGIGVTSTRLYFWVYLAMIIFILNRPIDRQTDRPTDRQTDRPTDRQTVKESIIYGLLGALALSFFCFALLKKKFFLSGETIPANFYYVMLSIGVLLIIPMLSSGHSVWRFRSGIWNLLYIGIALSGAVIFYYILVYLLNEIIRSEIIRNFVRDPTVLSNFCYIFIGIVMFILAIFIPQPSAKIPIARGRMGITSGLIGLILLAIVVFIIYQTNLKEVYADTYCRIGENYEKSQVWSQAINSFKKCIELSSRSDYYYSALSRAYRSNKDYSEAVDVLRDALKVNHYNAFHHFEIARIYREWAETLKDNPTEKDVKLNLAIEEYQKLTQLVSQNPRIYKETGEVYFIKNEPQKAIEQYLTALKLDDRFAEIYLLLARVYKHLNQRDKTIEVYEKGFGVEPNSIAIKREFMSLGEEYFNKQQFEDALRVNLSLIRLDPQDYRHYCNASVVLDQLGRLDEAIEYSRKAENVILNPMQRDGIRNFRKKLEEKKK
jgi:tetratricopeptide (TPR) repeat protein